MVAIAVLFAVYVFIYSGFVLWLASGFARVERFNSDKQDPKTTFSIVIPFRTEEKNLPALLESITRLEYPKESFELIFINDASEDFSENLINKWRMANGSFATTMIDNIRLSGSPKKDAISRAIPIAKGDFVITTDADCELPGRWLATFDAFIRSRNAEMVAGPVIYGGKNNFLDHFQRLDFLSLQGVTIGSFGLGKPFMCNGANFAYARSFFNEIGGFRGVDDFASGDDVMLLQKAVRRFPEKVAYLKSADAIVKTQPAKTWGELFNQRVRWASKAVGYDHLLAENLALVTFLANLFLVISAICTTTDFFDWRLPLVLFILKLIPDWIMLSKTNGFFRNSRIVFPVFASLCYPFFVSVVAIWAIIGRYRWKGRVFKK
ncbi:glycosyltransferase family 2 protein [Flavobacterium selenitireducens]|uniref:glycosyltransferase family 2 protein n=1 Tax=Flavobacterium selenitireducens TaxID=2722704 RepID=UPI00168BBE71|nr:glycosyltransferase [Flavobacterium selenitireducens]MBD3582019.1 glycosyltransferase [Flavobacterium selenitireducens]